MTNLQTTNRLSQPAMQERLDQLLTKIQSASAKQIGYPANQTFDYSALLPFLDYSLNNVGDPFHTSNYWSNTHGIEQEVITRFADLMRIAPEEAWGYVTSGGTEGNLYGLYLAREMFPSGIFYFSEETHYSVLKNMRVLNARHTMIKRQDNGEIDYQNLYEMVEVNRHLPAVIIANIGTTMRGAVDDIERIKDILRDLEVAHTYIHADAALSGMILPFVDDPQPYGFDAGINSIAVSGHKLIGAPLPCGVVLTRKAYVERVGPRHRISWHPGYHPVRLPQRADPADALVRPESVRRRGVPGIGRRYAGHGGIRGGAVQPARDGRLAAPELGYSGFPQTRAGGLSEVADCPGGRDRPHHHYAPCDARDD